MRKPFNTPIFRLLLIALAVISVSLLFAWLSSVLLREKPNVIIITANSLRPEHLSCYGYKHIETKTLDKLAQEGILFEKAYCSVPNAIHSYASILTGKNGGEVISQKGDTISLKTSYELLCGYLGNAGYIPIAVVSNPAITSKRNFEKDFAVFENVSLTPPGTQKAQINLPTDRALEILKKYNHDKKPVFMWLEYSIPRRDYVLPENFKKAQDSHPYDRQVLFLDEELQKFFQGLKKLGMDRNTIIIFTAATGTAFNEHGEPSEGIFIYDTTTRVPLIIKSAYLPGQKRINALASHTDITPTILDLLNIDYPSNEFNGINLTPVIKGPSEAQEKRGLYLESLMGYYSFAWSPVVGLVTDGHKYIELPKPELYDLSKDPHELHNIVEQTPLKAGVMKDELLKYIEEKRPELTGIIDKGADPKEKIGLLKPVNFTDIDANSKIRFLKLLLSRDPKNKEFKYLLGEVYYNTGRIAEGIRQMIELTQTYPDFNRAWQGLGLLYEKENNPDKAIECYNKALAIDPDMPISLNNLAWRYAEKGINLDEALEYAEKANELTPNMPSILDTLANIYFKMGNKDKAEELLEQAIAVNPHGKKVEYLQERLKEIQTSE
ncbi:MAG: sulfatase-like hydrolase/transferase [Candidatus Omnitrophota bacterium]|nr:sulfatase-like hydrolase/transferase [Candidatus Omnitrophota bacterium]